jgi:catechol 2,3-dioxygenase-like lactoylglutathione lyase family enzyme
MKIKVTSVYVDDQEKALRFYTEVLGFAKKNDFSQGPYRWLTVVSPEEKDGE